MKLILIIYDFVYDEAIRELLARIEVPGFTEIPLAFGTGESGKRHGSHVWPGHNRMIFTILPTDQAERFLQALKAFKASLAERRQRPGGIKAFVLRVEGEV
ncbi:MAG: hypothetical protein HY347_01945 [candidate division NC10 bacterium]|nr:hypothetical protein [candidate division NC10 bacterium]